jgi:hypothetical protein
LVADIFLNADCRHDLVQRRQRDAFSFVKTVMVKLVMKPLFLVYKIWMHLFSSWKARRNQVEPSVGKRSWFSGVLEPMGWKWNSSPANSNKQPRNTQRHCKQNTKSNIGWRLHLLYYVHTKPELLLDHAQIIQNLI